MNVRIGILILATALAGSVAKADDSMHAEFGIVSMRFSGGGGSLTPTVGIVRWGYDFTKNLSTEITAAATLKGDSSHGPNFQVDNAFGAYLKARGEVGRGFDLFAKVGAVRTQLSASGLGSSSDNSFSYAAGAELHFSKLFYGQIDYASYYNKDGVEGAGPSLSFGMSF